MSGFREANQAWRNAVKVVYYPAIRNHNDTVSIRMNVIVLYIPFNLIHCQTHYHLNLEACSSQLPVPEACVTSSSQVHHQSVFPAVNQFNSESVKIFRSVATTRNMRRKVQPRMVNVFFLHCLKLTAHCCLPEIFRKRMNRPCFWQIEMLQYIQYNLIPLVMQKFHVAYTVLYIL